MWTQVFVQALQAANRFKPAETEDVQHIKCTIFIIVNLYLIGKFVLKNTQCARNITHIATTSSLFFIQFIERLSQIIYTGSVKSMARS